MESSLEDLKTLFGMKDRITFEGSSPDFPVATLHTPSAKASVAIHGGHVLSYIPEQEKPVLWLSKESHFTEGKAIRGGIPVIWPWFGPHQFDTDKPSHGFARTRFWDLHSTRVIDSLYPQIRFQLVDSEITRQLWPHQFNLELVVTLTDALTVELIIQNNDQDPFSFTCALHSYFSVSHISNIKILGLEQANYIDQLDRDKQKIQVGPITFDAEKDNIYVDTTAACRIVDPVYDRTIIVEKAGSNSTVIWNPWIAKAARMSDFGNDEYTDMLCIEAANAAHNSVTLGPSEQHTLSTTIRTEQN